MTSSDDTIFSVLESRRTPRCMLWSDAASGLRAVLVIDDWTLGPAAGGIRTRAYPSLAAAMDDAANLARAMTLKCSLAQVDAGGAKVVVLDHPGMDRPAAFERLGELVDDLGGRFITAGDLGTTAADLERVARHTRHVHTAESSLEAAVARGLLACIVACVEARHGGSSVTGMRVAVQGCGAIGAEAARTLVAAGATVVVADIDEARARALADAIGAEVMSADDIVTADVDIVCPCAVGGVVTTEVADAMRAWAVCGAANNIVAGADAERRLLARGIVYVPDVVASAGGAVAGIAPMIMGIDDYEPLIAALGMTAREILAEQKRTGKPAGEIAEALAWARIHTARGKSVAITTSTTMRTYRELEERWRDSPRSPRDRGTVELIVMRPSSDERVVPDSAEISPEGGLVGDRWSMSETPKPDAQLTLMNARVARLIAASKGLDLFGDNFIVDLDLSVEALPAGTRLRLGECLVEVTPEPHNGCKKFRLRFGVDALRWVNHKGNRGERLRGLHCRVIRGGRVRVGDTVEVVRGDAG